MDYRVGGGFVGATSVLAAGFNPGTAGADDTLPLAASPRLMP
jgi:hypothetical protein